MGVLENARAEARGLIAKLTLEQKVGQLFMLAFGGKDLSYAKELVQQRFVSGFYISQDNAETILEAKNLTKTLQEAVCSTELDLPLILGVDQEGAWGVAVSETTTGPGNLALGSADDTSLTHDMYGIYAQEMMACGYNVILSPCSDINSNPDNPIIGTRSFGEDRDKVSRHVKAAVEGALSNHIVCCGKHFPGHGDTGEDSHRLLPTVDRSMAYLLDQDLVPFQVGIDAGLPMIMTSHINFPQIDPDYPATLSRKIMHDLLRERMGFEGVIVTDSMNMWGMRKNYDPAESAILALKAGCDIVMLSEEHYEHDASNYVAKQMATIDGVIQAVNKGDLALDVVENALERIFNLRLQLARNENLRNKDSDDVLTERHQDVADRAADKAIRVVRDRDDLLPLKGKVKLIGLSGAEAHQMVINTRGIGPNDPQAAFDVLCEELKSSSVDVEILSEPDLQDYLIGKEHFDEGDIILAVSEDYPLPGMDYDVDFQKERLNQLIHITKGKMVVCALRSDYELRSHPDLSTYVAAYSSRACAARAMARFIAKAKTGDMG
ncbi:glycoside hydrolase family 3 N-terminal domain-containing protein [uncultured Kiloniella sp.]|uniref:glycoside hydrolase family 3 protein n=1 Tax=uncultured Kiloniella sp. TaxID=1133091 RepID=UPI00262EA4A3|nr:glycoside hydrolase family 3 N-terminal domain-containing protein [uncultured Kiloniella sp.]